MTKSALSENNEQEAGKNRLGRGLAALIGEVPAVAAEQPKAEKTQKSLQTLPMAYIAPNPNNPRKTFKEPELHELAESIRNNGLVQPILVRPAPGPIETYEIVAGERRWRAAQIAEIHEVPVIIRELTDQQALELAIVENIQRADLDAIEEAAGYNRLIEEFKYTQQELAETLGKSRSHVANTMRLLKLPDNIQELVVDGKLSAGHARALIGVETPEKYAERIIENELSVRDVEELVKEPLDAIDSSSFPSDKTKKSRSNSKIKEEEKDLDTKALERALGEALGLEVLITHKDGKGEIKIEFATIDQFDFLCRKLQRPIIGD